MLFDTVLAFDHVQHRILLIANARISGDEELRGLYQFACAKIDFLERELERALSLPRPERRRAADARRRTSRSRRSKRSSGRRRSTSPRATSIRSCSRSGSRRRSASIRSRSIARCATSTRRLTCSSSAWAAARSSGSSPEMLVRVEGRHAVTHPIAGTRPRGRTDEEDQRLADELKRNEKERAEHVMLVDLGRNDLGRVCQYGSVRVPTFMALERYSHVMHLVSVVEGQLAEDQRSARRAGRRAFRPGTVSGAPKVRAMQIINDARADARGIYAGAVGYLDFAGQSRLLHRDPHHRPRRRARRRAGRRRHRRRLESDGGIRRDARQGARDDARARTRAVGSVAHGARHRQLRFVHLQPRPVPGRAGGERSSCAATTRRRSTRSARSTPTRILISPGPGPSGRRRHHARRDQGTSATRCRRWASASGIRPWAWRLAGRWSARRCRCTARRRRSSTTAAASSPASAASFQASRYHSLVVAEEGWPEDLEVTARSKEDGLVMGLRHRTLAAARRAVPPRVDPHARGPAHSAQLPRAVRPCLRR